METNDQLSLPAILSPRKELLFRNIQTHAKQKCISLCFHVAVSYILIPTGRGGGTENIKLASRVSPFCHRFT